jgi:hypothetical protein
MPTSQMTGDPRYLSLLEEMADLHRRKAADYGSDEDPLANIRASEEIGIPAWKGAWLRAKDKVKRIDRFCCKGTLVNESVGDSLMDLSAYALLALVLLRESKLEEVPPP